MSTLFQWLPQWLKLAIAAFCYFASIEVRLAVLRFGHRRLENRTGKQEEDHDRLTELTVDVKYIRERVDELAARRR